MPTVRLRQSQIPRKQPASGIWLAASLGTLCKRNSKQDTDTDRGMLLVHAGTLIPDSLFHYFIIPRGEFPREFLKMKRLQALCGIVAPCICSHFRACLCFSARREQENDRKRKEQNNEN
jgi:hypothetical protein